MKKINKEHFHCQFVGENKKIFQQQNLSKKEKKFNWNWQLDVEENG